MTQVKSVPPMVWTRKSAAVSLLQAVEAHQREMGQRLAAFRDQQGLTQEELAHKAGVSNKTVSRLENGHHEPELDTIRKLAKALEVEEGEIRGMPPSPLGLGEQSQLDRIEDTVNRIAAALLEQTVADAEEAKPPDEASKPKRAPRSQRPR